MCFVCNRPLVCVQYEDSLYEQRGNAEWAISDIYHSLCQQEIAIQGLVSVIDFLVDFGKTDKLNTPDFGLHTFLSFFHC